MARTAIPLEGASTSSQMPAMNASRRMEKDGFVYRDMGWINLGTDGL